MTVVRILTSAYLIQSAAAAAYAFRHDLRAEPFGIGLPLGMTAEFLIGWGTAISPGLPLYVVLVAALAATWHPRIGRRSAFALGVLGAFMFLGHLVERVVWTGFAADPLVAVFALGGALLGLAIAAAVLVPALRGSAGTPVRRFAARNRRRSSSPASRRSPSPPR